MRQQDWLADKKIAELGLRKEGIIVLGITRKDGTYLGAPDGMTKIKKHDVLILYGQAKTMQELDQRKAGAAGNREHREKIADQKKIKMKEKEKDEA